MDTESVMVGRGVYNIKKKLLKNVCSFYSSQLSRAQYRLLKNIEKNHFKHFFKRVIAIDQPNWG